MKLHRYTTWVVTHVTTAPRVRVKRHSARTIHVDHDETERCLLSLLSWRDCRSIWWTHHVTFLTPDHNLQNPQLYKMHINHLLITFDFKASQCTCSIFFSLFFFFEKTQWTKWIVSLWERAAGRFMFIHYATALLRPHFFSLTFSFLCPRHQSENKHSPTFKHTSPYLFTSKYQSLTTNWK